MRASGCDVPAWMLGLTKGPKAHGSGGPARAPIGTGSKFDRVQSRKRRSMIEATQRRSAGAGDEGAEEDAGGEEEA